MASTNNIKQYILENLQGFYTNIIKNVLPKNQSAVDGGTDTSLVTTGEKYIWNNKIDETGNDLTLDYTTISLSTNNCNLYMDQNSNMYLDAGTLYINKNNIEKKFLAASSPSGTGSFAVGGNVTASGKNSHAEGNGTCATNDWTHAEGYASLASGDTAHAEGAFTSALGTRNHTEGQSTYTSGINAHAEGYKTTAIGSPTYDNYASHAEGNNTYAANGSHAEGYLTSATGRYSHAEGVRTTANDFASHAEGNYTIANYSCSHAEGSQTTASGMASHAEGGFVLTLEDSYGDDTDFYFFNAAQGDGSHAEGGGTIARGNVSHAEGYKNVASGFGAHAEGGMYGSLDDDDNYIDDVYNVASGNGSHAEGGDTLASGGFSHAEGYGTRAIGSDSHAEGSETSASGHWSHAEGGDTTASANCSHAEGENTLASGGSSHAEGENTTASGFASHASGYSTIANNYSSMAIGHYNTNMTGGGSYNNTTGTAFAIGKGTSATAKSNAFSVQYNGVVKAAGTITASTTADYAENFEWLDGNIDNKDRVGLFVTLDGDKVRIANSNDKYILGIVSGAPFVLGNGDCDVWNGMFLRDEFNRIILEPAPKIIEQKITKEYIDEDGNVKTKIVGTEYVEVEGEFEGTREKLNPEYDPNKPYINRADRPEWSPIGMLGVLSVKQDGTLKVNEYATVSDSGIATYCEDEVRNSYRVIEVISDKVARVVFR